MKAYTEIVRKYYKYGTTPNATIIGSLTVNNGVASGFSSSKYMTLPTAFNGSAGSTWEIVFKVKTPTLNTLQQFLAVGNQNSYNSYFGVTTANVFRFRLSTNTSGSVICNLIGTTTIIANTDYWVKAEFTGSAYNLYLSTDGVNYTLEATTTSSSIWTQYTFSWIGKGGDNNSLYPWLGSIDLTKSYIKVNDNDWWRGTFIEESTSSDYDFYKDINVCKLYKEIIRKYYKYVAWTQPILSANGTMGGNSFAVEASTTESGHPAYYAFDGSDSTRWGATSSSVPQWLTFYNPEKLKVTNIAIKNRSDIVAGITAGIIKGSNDNINWIDIKSFTNSETAKGATWNIDLSNNINSYNYYRIYITSYLATGGSYVCIITAIITGYTITESTSSDYDFYKDVDEYKAFNV